MLSLMAAVMPIQKVIEGMALDEGAILFGRHRSIRKRTNAASMSSHVSLTQTHY